MPETTHSLKMDLKKEGLLMFFKHYQLEILKVLWSMNHGLNSREIWEAINQVRSRASVINFLEEMVLNGLLDKHEVTGKGGHHGVYKSVFDEQGTRKYLKKIFKERLNQL